MDVGHPVKIDAIQSLTLADGEMSLLVCFTLAVRLVCKLLTETQWKGKQDCY